MEGTFWPSELPKEGCVNDNISAYLPDWTSLTSFLQHADRINTNLYKHSILKVEIWQIFIGSSLVS